MAFKKSDYQKTVEEIITLLMSGMGWDLDRALLWYETPNPLLGGVSAKSMTKLGRGHKVLKFIRASLDENGTAP